MGQEGHAEVMSTEHKSTGKVYRHHITKGLPRVRSGVLAGKSLIDKTLKLQDRSVAIQLEAYKCDDADAVQCAINNCGAEI